MAHMSRRFNFDDFDEQIREALDSNSEGMADLLPIRQPRPGEIGGVACHSLSLEGPAQPDNVVDLRPPDDAA